MKIKQAAFRNKDGVAVGTGPIHNVEALPEDFEIDEEGFLTEDGQFLTRKEVTDFLNNACPVQSQELGLKKSHLESEYQITPPKEEDTNLRFDVIHKPTGKSVGALKIARKPSSAAGTRHAGYHFVNDISVDRAHQRKGLASQLYAAASNHVKSLGSKGIASQGEWRSEAADAAWKRMAAKNPEIKRVRGVGGNTDFRLSEEPMDKAQVAPGFPKIGVENPKTTPIVSNETTFRGSSHDPKYDTYNKNPTPQKEYKSSVGKSKRKSLSHAAVHALIANHATYAANKKEIQAKFSNPKDTDKYKKNIIKRARDYIKKRNEIRKIHKLGAHGVTSPKTSPISTSFAYLQSDGGDLSTKHHEDQHLTFNKLNRYFEKNPATASAEFHAPKDRSAVFARNLYHHINEESRDALHSWVRGTTGEAFSDEEPHPVEDRKWHEEHLAHLISYLNNPARRIRFMSAKGRDMGAFQVDPNNKDKKVFVMNEKGLAFDKKIKKGFRDYQHAARNATSDLGDSLLSPEKIRERITQKSQAETIDLMKWEPSEEDQKKALDMMSGFYSDLPEFKAATFLSHGYIPSEEDIHNALSEFEGDFEAMSLMAHKLPVTESMVAELRQVMAMDLMKKSEPVFEVAAIPRIVKPFSQEDIPISKVVRNAFERNAVHPVKLGGKHSAGSALLKDKNNQIWFLKPGSGKTSSALGLNEETASQSRREVAFNRIAALMGLGHYIPNSALLLVDGKEVAALEFFSDGFKGLDKLKKDKDVHLEQIFDKFVGNGLLYKWAAMDYLLGQVDRHAGNMMMDEGHNIRFIDAGSTMAGFGFAPAKDPKSFVPFYLRLFSEKKFKNMTPEERFKSMPEPTPQADVALKGWLESLDREAIIAILNQYGINPEPFNRRLNQIVKYPGPKSEYLRKFYSNLISGDIKYDD